MRLREMRLDPLLGLREVAERRKESFPVLLIGKQAFSKPFQRGPLIDYSALNASNQRLYAATISSETLGFLSSNISLKSLMAKGLG